MSDNDTNNPPKHLKRKTMEITVEKVNRPDPALNILDMFKANSNMFFETSNWYTVDVFPNMIPIFMYIILTSIRHYGLVTNRDYSKITPSTICMYYMCIVYGFFLINDLEVRPTPSAHARSWRDCSYKRDFVKLLRGLPVPEFLSTILAQFHASETDRTKNVYFVPSAAGYDHNQFFGRVFPINFFAEVHDCVSTLSSSSTLIQVLQNLYTRPLYTIEAGYTCLIPDLIGVTINRTTNTTVNYYNSKLYQVCNCLFNPVLFRDIQRRPTLAALSLQAPAYPNDDINAYDMMFAATPNNLRELQVVLQAVAAVISPTITLAGKLDEVISKSSGNTIFMHGYSTYPLPTWSHGEETAKLTDFEKFTTHTRITPSSRARDFSFLQRPTEPLTAATETIDVIYGTTADPTKAVAIPAEHVITRHFPGSLRANQDATYPFPRTDTTALTSFNDAIDVAPMVLVLDTEGNQGLSAYLATLSGKVIESFELDGSSVEMPSAEKSLGTQNSLFADSAIPYRYVRPGSDFHPRANGEILPPLTRRINTPNTRQTAATMLHSRNLVMLPKFQRLIDAALGTQLPGMTTVPGAVTTRYNQSMIGFTCCDGSSNANIVDAVPAMPEGRLLVWSPYTYTPYESDDWPTADLSQSKHYYLTNLRTLFGTDYNLVMVEHAYNALPVV